MKDYTEKDNLYCYKGTAVLKNKLNITDYEKLACAEDEITSVNLAGFQQRVFEDELNYDFFLWLHKFVFSDIYEWAGALRKVDISKENFKFAHYLFVENELRKLFKQVVTLCLTS
jgi:cell filamentation protein